MSSSTTADFTQIYTDLHWFFHLSKEFILAKMSTVFCYFLNLWWLVWKLSTLFHLTWIFLAESVIHLFTDWYTGTDRYINIRSAMTWYEAQRYCRQHHTDLASARNQTEQSIIQGKISKFSWIGLFRDFWKWVDGTNTSRIPWIPGAPNNAKGKENCGYSYDNQADDAQCSYLMPFFCYSSKLMLYRLRFKLL